MKKNSKAVSVFALILFVSAAFAQATETAVFAPPETTGTRGDTIISDEAPLYAEAETDEIVEPDGLTLDPRERPMEPMDTPELTLGNAGEDLRIDSDVGLGVDDPVTKLHVRGTSAGDGTWNEGILIENTNSTAGEPTLSFKNSATGTNYWFTGLNQSAHYDIAYGTSFTNGNTKVRFEAGGNVGIGTTAPAYKLDVSGTGRFTGQVTIPVTPTANAHAASKQYVDGLIGGGVGTGTINPVSYTHLTLPTKRIV